MKVLKNLTVTVFFFLSMGSYAQVVINEYMVSNSATSGGDPTLSVAIPPFDCSGTWTTSNEDVVELYNSGISAVALTGYYLSDNPAVPLKWQIPYSPSGALLSIPAGGYQIFYCSKMDSAYNSGGVDIYHTNFGLTQCKGEFVILADPTGLIIDSVYMNVRTQNMHTRGRLTDGDPTWGVFTSHTLGSANVGAYNGYAQTPILSLGAGFYAGTQNITIVTSDPSDQVYYTIDGTEPTTASTLYSGPIVISGTTVLKVKNFSADAMLLPSSTATNTYFINVSHSIPVLSVSGNQVLTLLNGTQLDAYGFLEYFDASGTFKSEASGFFNKHGNDSWAYDQRGIDFVAHDWFGINYAIREKIFPSKPRKNYQRLIIKAGASDNFPFESGGAHIRDPFVQTMSQVGKLHLDERTYKGCVVYANGQYWGVYDLREKVDDHDFTSYYYNQDEYKMDFLKTWGSTWEEYGCREAWDTLVTYITTNSMAVQANYDSVKTALNVGSLIDYFCLNSIIFTKDWLNWNTAWWHGKNPLGDKKKWRYTLWDMDAVYGHYINYTGIPDESTNADPCNAENLPNPGSQGHTEIMTALLNNAEFSQKYISRYIDLINTSLSCDRQIEILDSLVAIIDPEMAAHATRWGGAYSTWQQNVQTLRDSINLRCTGLVNGLINCYGLDGPYNVTFDVDALGYGNIKVNSVVLDAYPWTGQYYGGVEVLLKAIPNLGYKFIYWEIHHHTPQPSTLIVTTPDTTDLEISLMLTQDDSIIAHFCPEFGKCFEGAFVPTGFSPNDDGVNDVLHVLIGKDIFEMEWVIYDRWGEKMFSTTDQNFGWDGTFRGEQVNVGVYAYTLYAKYYDGTVTKTGGNVTLLR